MLFHKSCHHLVFAFYGISSGFICKAENPSRELFAGSSGSWQLALALADCSTARIITSYQLGGRNIIDLGSEDESHCSNGHTECITNQSLWPHGCCSGPLDKHALKDLMKKKDYLREINKDIERK